MIAISSPSQTPSFNLAAEEYLFKESSEDILFLYVNTEAVIIGSNQAVMNEVDIDYCIENGILIIRRMSGGGAVYHDLGNLNYTFIQNKREGISSLSADFLLPIVEVLKTLQIPVIIGKRKDLWLPGGYKISGTASHVSRGRELHHGTLLYDANLEKLQRSLTTEIKVDHPLRNKKATASVPSTVKNMKTYLSEIGASTLEAQQFFEEFTTTILAYFKIDNLNSFNDNDLDEIELLRKSKYIQREWNYRM